MQLDTFTLHFLLHSATLLEEQLRLPLAIRYMLVY